MQRMLDALEHEREIAVDTEGDSFYHYREQVCLIQVTAGGADYVVDPLKGFDLDGFGRVLASPQRTKIFHDGEYDIRILKGTFGFSIAGLFDTRVAAAALGFEAPGLAAVVEERFGVKLDKSLQRSNWSARPLTADQIDYARLDTRFLIPLADQLREELASRDRTMIVEGECRRLEALEPAARTFEPDEFIRLKGARALDLGQMTVLRELFVLRDELARDRDLPPFKIFGNHVLVEAARSGARSPRQLERISGLSPKLIRRWGSQLVAAIERGREAGPLPRVPRLPPKDGTGGLDEEQVELHDRLKSWRKHEATRLEMDASLVLNRHVLHRLTRDRPLDRESLESVDGVLDWQVELLGDGILEVVREFQDDLKTGRFKPIPRGRKRGGKGRSSRRR